MKVFLYVITDQFHLSSCLDGKYVVLPSGELQIRNVVKEDGDKTYKVCSVAHSKKPDIGQLLWQAK